MDTNVTKDAPETPRRGPITASELATLRALEQHLQAELEYEMKEYGQNVLAERTALALDKGTESETRAGRHILKTVVADGSKSIRKSIKEALTGRSGRLAAAAVLLQGEDPDVLSYLTARALVNNLSTANANLTHIAGELGAAVDDERRMAHFAQVNPGAFRWTKDRVRTVSSRRTRCGVALAIMRLKSVDWDGWTHRQQVLVGLWLVDAFIAGTGLFTQELVGRGGTKTAWVVKATPETAEWAAKIAADAHIAACDWWPTIIPPRAWKKPWGGGYHTPIPGRIPILRSSDSAVHPRSYLTELSNLDLSRVYEAVNIAQDTPWVVNTKVLEILERAVSEGISIGDIPTQENVPLPPRPADIATNVEARKKWRKEASFIHEINKRRASRRFQIYRTVNMARRFKDYPAIWFPHRLDFRGRMYPLPSFLSPQGADPTQRARSP